MELEDEDKANNAINAFLSSTVDRALAALQDAYCLAIEEVLTDTRLINSVPCNKNSQSKNGLKERG